MGEGALGVFVPSLGSCVPTNLLIGPAPVIVTEDNAVGFGRGGGAAADAGDGVVVEACAAAADDDTEDVGFATITPFFRASFSFLQNFLQWYCTDRICGSQILFKLDKSFICIDDSAW